jgi:hypothetical protein
MTESNTPLINLVIRELVERDGIDYEEAIHVFYTSRLFSLMQNSTENTYRTWAAADLVDEMKRIETLPR